MIYHSRAYYPGATTEYLSGLKDMRCATLSCLADSIGRKPGIIGRSLKAEGKTFKEYVHDERKKRILEVMANNPRTQAKGLVDACGVSDAWVVQSLIKQYTGLGIVEFRKDPIGHMTAGSGLA